MWGETAWEGECARNASRQQTADSRQGPEDRGHQHSNQKPAAFNQQPATSSIQPAAHQEHRLNGRRAWREIIEHSRHGQLGDAKGRAIETKLVEHPGRRELSRRESAHRRRRRWVCARDGVWSTDEATIKSQGVDRMKQRNGFAVRIAHLRTREPVCHGGRTLWWSVLEWWWHLQQAWHCRGEVIQCTARQRSTQERDARTLTALSSESLLRGGGVIPPFVTAKRSVACGFGRLGSSRFEISRFLPHPFDNGAGMYVLSMQPVENVPAGVMPCDGFTAGSRGAQEGVAISA